MSVHDEKNAVDPSLKDIANSFWGYFVFHRKMAVLIGLIFVGLGLFSYFGIPREAQPEIEIPFASVVTSYQGASPQEVADQVTFELEQKILNLENLKEVISVSSEGVSQIFVEFTPEADLETSIRELKDKVDEAKGSLPSDANDPFVQETSTNDFPVIIFSLFGDLPYDQLLDAAQMAQEALEKIPGVQSADISGERENHILVSVRETDMIRYGLSLRSISRSIQAFHMSSPVGNILVDDQFYQIRIASEQDTKELIGQIPVSAGNGATVYLADVADVTEEFKEATSASLVSLNGEPSKSAISINLIKRTGANVIETVDEAREVFDALKLDGSIPSEIETISLNDTAEITEQEFDRLMGNAITTVALIFVILLFALGFKEALIGGISIPFTFFVTFTYLYQQGSTFNFMVLFSLILGLGLLVDATIVIMEGMHENLYTRKMTPVNAALATIKTYRYPLMSGMLTTIAAFAPMLLVSGTIGKFFAFIPITVSTVLISSLAIGLFLMPAYAVIFMKQVKQKKEKGRFVKWLHAGRERFVGWIGRYYRSLLHRLLRKLTARIVLLILALVAFVSAVSLPIKNEGFPLVDAENTQISVELPVGTALDKLEPVVAKMEPILKHNEHVESYVVNMRGGSSGSTATATFTVNFTDSEERDIKSFELEQLFKEKFKFITEGEVTITESRSGPPTGADIQILVYGDDFSILKEISEDIQAQLVVSGGDQVTDNLKDGSAEFTFDFTPYYEKTILAQQGLTVADVAQEVRMAVFPSTAVTIKRDDEEIDVDVQRDWGGVYPTSVDQVNSILIQSNTGDYVPLSSLAEADLGSGLTSINNYDGERAITISSGVSRGLVVDDVKEKLVPYLEEYVWPDGYSYEILGGGDEVAQSFVDLTNAMVLSIVLIFLILVTQFNSYKQPFVILMSLPLSLIGVFYGFFALGLSFSVAAVIGIVSLSGIVINDAIILIDRINKNRDSGMKIIEAIEEAGPARMQPIIITSVTTVLGILPISLTDPFWLALGMAIAFGMLFSTVLTLIIVPVFYYSVELYSRVYRRFVLLLILGVGIYLGMNELFTQLFSEEVTLWEDVLGYVFIGLWFIFMMVMVVTRHRAISAEHREMKII